MIDTVPKFCSPITFSAVLTVACGGIAKPPEPSRRLSFETTGSIFESSGGYVFAALPEPGANVVRIDVRYPVGAAQDPPGKAGLAHLVEHLLFERELEHDGRKTTLGAELGRIAIWSNAETDEDYTDFQVLAPREALDEVLGLEAERVSGGCTGITPEIVAREREVVANEMRERQGASGAQLERVIKEALFPEGSPYRPVDSVDTVSALQLADVCQFLFGPYRQGRAIVIASGAVTDATMRAAVEHHFATVKKRDPAAAAIASTLPAAPGKVRVRADVDEPMLLAAWPLPAQATREYRLLRMVWGRIATRTEQFAYTFDWGHSGFSTILGGAYAPVLVVGITLSSTDKQGDAVEAIGKAADQARYAIGQERDSRAWMYSWTGRAESEIARWETLGGRNAVMGDILQFEAGKPTLIADRIAELSKATPDETRDLAAKWLSPDRARYILVEPSGTTAIHAATAYGGGAPERGVAVDTSLADQPVRRPSSLPLGIDTYELPNGLKVMLWPDGSSPVVQGRLVVLSGSAQEPAGADGIAWFSGADVVGSDALVFETRSLSPQVDELVQSLALELRFPGEELDDKQKEYVEARLRVRSAKERADYDHDLQEALYGTGHPYAHHAMSAESVSKLHRDLVMDWARSHIVPKNSVLILTGAFDAAVVKQHILYNLAHMSSGSRPKDPPLQIASRDAPAWISGYVQKPSPTLELDVLFPGGPGLDGSYAKRLVLAQMLSSRLEELRGVNAVTYGLGASYIPRRAGGEWVIRGDVDASRADEAARQLTTILAEMRTHPESNRAAFVLARQKVLENLLASRTSSGAVADRLVAEAMFGLADEAYDSLAVEVAGLTAADLQPFLVQELDPKREVFGAFGNVGPVQAALSAAKGVH